MPLITARSCSDLKLANILDFLPLTNRELNNALDKYHRLKHSSTPLAIVFWFLEVALAFWWNLGQFALFMVPSEISRSWPGENDLNVN